MSPVIYGVEVKPLSDANRQAGRGHLLNSLSPAHPRGLLRVEWLHVPGGSWLCWHPHQTAQRNLPPPAAAASSGISSALPCSSPFPAASGQRAEEAAGDAGTSSKPSLRFPNRQESTVPGTEPAGCWNPPGKGPSAVPGWPLGTEIQQGWGQGRVTG